jgi:hypothetical protein
MRQTLNSVHALARLTVVLRTSGDNLLAFGTAALRHLVPMEHACALPPAPRHWRAIAANTPRNIYLKSYRCPECGQHWRADGQLVAENTSTADRPCAVDAGLAI